ncbi:HD domain-containing protein [Candidatus Margulisiibacteriota bacterium]
MIKSARQFFQSIFLKANKEDLKYFEQYLNIKEKALFSQFSGFEKLHAVRTAKRVKKLVHGRPEIDERKMERAALLHDIGRISGRITVFDKVWLKLMKHLARPVYNKLAEKGRDPGAGSRKLYIHKYHGEVAEEFLRRAGTDDAIIDLIVKHAQKPRKDDSEELKLLRRADRTS